MNDQSWSFGVCGDIIHHGRNVWQSKMAIEVKTRNRKKLGSLYAFKVHVPNVLNAI